MTNSPNRSPAVLVTDFDGTMTDVDFYRVAMQHLLPPGSPTYFEEYRAGEITHFEALRRIFGAIPQAEDEVVELLDRMKLDPDVPATVERLKAAGWDVMVVSAGCAWYIEQLFQRAGVELEVYASPGRFVPGKGLLMELPEHSPYFSETHGIDKALAVRAVQQRGQRAAFAGNNESDLPAARLVPAELRFARDELPALLEQEGLGFHTFDRWSQIADILLS